MPPRVMIAATDLTLMSFFWVSVSGIAYSYVGYPILLRIGSRIAARRRPRPHGVLRPLPSLTVIFAAFNEEGVIAEKLTSLVNSNFPAGRLEVLVGNDASTDATPQIVAAFAREHPFIRLVSFAGRTGKPAIVNALAAQSKGTILALTDANIMFDPDALLRIANWFTDPEVGLVGANIITRNLTGRGGIAQQEDAYIRRELRMKAEQSILSGVIIAPFGACYAIRREDFQPVPAGYSVDDFYIAMRPQILGRRAVQDMKAICREDPAEHMSSEFTRKARISRGNFQNLSAFRAVALRPWSALGFHFVSHKVLRWLGPGLILLSYLACGALAIHTLAYRVLFLVMVAGLASPAVDGLLRSLGMTVRLIRFASYFLMMNVALGYGFILWALRRNGSIWQPTRRA
jgi:cellulose synthase/poly-beta-1,6-N-acetylglucosamine synthase-like glycosyltransferase